MPLRPPVLDDRRFADLVAEARSRIPRYTPEWTDHNDTDPGITLVQLFAWLTELLIYRLNQVPDLHYVKFLQLLGIERRPAAPAEADLAFTVQRDVPYALVPARARVGVAGSEPPVVFEVREAFTALGGALAGLQVYDGATYASVLADNDTLGRAFAPFGSAAREGSALYLGFETPGAFPAQEVSLMVYLKATQTRTLRCSPGEIDVVLPVRLAWEYRAPTGWAPLAVVRDETGAFTRDGVLRFLGPKDLVRTIVGPIPDPARPPAPLYWIRSRLVSGRYEMPPAVDQILLNAARAESAETVRDEIVGGSAGTADQAFALRHSPVFEGTLELDVDEGRGFERWEARPDLLGSGPDDPHYVLNRATGEIRFGNGRRGRIPRAGLENVVARVYRYGGGASANTGADTITDLQTFVAGIDAVTNPRSAAGGADEEPVDEAKLHGPAAIRTRERAVTPEDFELLATEAPGARIRRAHALPLRHPEFPGAAIPGAVTVIVVPDWPADAEGPPVPTAATLANVCRHLDRFRLLTTELHVVGPTYAALEVEIPVFVRRGGDPNRVKTAVEAEVRRFFHPLTGGDEGLGWPFGGDVHFSDVYRVALKVPGVARVGTPAFVLNGQPQPECQDVPVPDGTLIDLRRLDVQIRFAEAE